MYWKPRWRGRQREPAGTAAAGAAASHCHFGLSITSSWGNGHATTYRSLVRALCRRGHEVLFLERDMPWYAANRDQLDLPAGSVFLYQSAGELRDRWRKSLAAADLVIIGSYVPDGIAVIRLVKSIASGIVAFYDIDTPVTLGSLAAGIVPTSMPELVAGFDLYLSFTGGRALQMLECRYGVRAARALYCSVDPERHRPVAAEPVWDMAYLGTYSADRQPALEELMVTPARHWPAGRFAVAGPLYPAGLLARQSRAHRACRPRSAPVVLCPAALRAQHHPRRHGPDGLLAERQAVRSGGMRRTGYQRLVARAPDHL